MGFVWIGIRIIYNSPQNLNDANYVYDSNNQSINFYPPWVGLSFGVPFPGKRAIYKTCIRVAIVNNNPNFGKWLDSSCNNAKVYSICEL